MEVGRWRIIAASSSLTVLFVADRELEDVLSGGLKTNVALVMSAEEDTTDLKALEECWMMLWLGDVVRTRLMDKSSGDAEAVLPAVRDKDVAVTGLCLSKASYTSFLA